MSSSVFVYDPTIKDAQSRVRGIGRYLQILRENFSDEFIFTDKPSTSNSQLQTAFINPFFNFLGKPLTLKRIAKKQIAVIHDLIPLKYPRHFPIGLKGTLFVTLNKLALMNYDIIVTDSLASKKDIIDILGLPEKKVKVVYPCLPKIFTYNHLKSQMSNLKTTFQISNLPTSTNFNQFQPISTDYCLYVGDATWNKNLVNLAKAIKKAEITCVFVGKVFNVRPGGMKTFSESQLSEQVSPKEVLALQGRPQDERSQHNGMRVDLEENFSSRTKHPWQKDLQEFFLLTNGDPHFIFKGFVNDEELISLYQNAVANILPSRDEGFGFSYLEASSQGCISVLSDIPVFHEISDNKAFFSNCNDADILSSVIKEIVSDEEKRKRMGQQAVDRSLFFSSREFRKLWKEIISG